MTVDAWEQILEDLESRLDAAERQVEGDRFEPVPAFAEPAVAAPIPEHLRARAQAAADRGEALRTRLEAEAGRIRADLRRLPTHRPEGRPAALFELGA